MPARSPTHPSRALRLMVAWPWLLCLACGEDAADGQPPEPIRFAPPPGTYTEPIELSATSALAGADIHYTLDGSLPTRQSPVWRAPIPIDHSTAVRAVAIRGQAEDEEKTKVVSGHYLRATPATMAFSSNLPIVTVHMLGRRAPPPDEYSYQRAGLQLFEPAGDARTVPVGTPAVDTRIGIKVRGRSTRLEPKRSFSIELWDEFDQEDHARPLLGMPAHADWALYAPYRWDHFGLRNVLMYALSNDLGEYAARTRFVEVFLVEGGGDVQASDYRGLHVLIERLKRDSGRIAVEALAPGDRMEPAVTGGYVVKVDSPGPNEQGFDAGGLSLVHVYPKEDDILAPQRDYIAGYFDQVARAAAAEDGRDPDSGLHYEALIDVGSFLDHHILNLLAKNPDALRLSAYFHKARGGPLRAGPIWDFDRALGSNDPRDDDPTGWNASGDGTDMFDYPLWRDLFSHPEFRDAYVDRLLSLLAGPLASERVHAHIDSFITVQAAAERDFERWPENRPPGGQYANELEALKAWTAERIAWMADNADSLRP